MTEFERLLTKTAGVLEKLEIPYMVTGGAAVVYWGRPRFTADIDIVIELSETNIKSLVQELRRVLGSKAYIDEEMIRMAERQKGSFNIIHTESGLKVDFFVIGKDLFEKSRFSRAVERRIDGQNVRFISPEDLILIKLLWHKETGSARQIEDVESIIAIQNEKLNKTYLRQWAERQSTIEILENLLKK